MLNGIATKFSGAHCHLDLLGLQAVLQESDLQVGTYTRPSVRAGESTFADLVGAHFAFHRCAEVGGSSSESQIAQISCWWLQSRNSLA